MTVRKSNGIILIIINTPAQLYFLRNIFVSLEKQGNEVFLLIRNYGENTLLAKAFNLHYITFSKHANSKYGKLIYFPIDFYTICKNVINIKPDIILGGGIYSGLVALLFKRKCLNFVDAISNQYKTEEILSTVILMPTSIKGIFRKNVIKINSYKELAYLHPKYYQPDESIKELLNLDNDQEYVLLRFNAFDAVHDFSIGGFNEQDKIQFVNALEKYVKVFISSEKNVPDEIKDRILKVPKNKIHDVIYFAKLLVADTGTMVTEAACLGTPAIMFHPNAKRMGNFIELEKEYQLIYCYDNNSREVILKAIELIQKPNLKQEWIKKRARLLNEKIDMKAFMVWFIENYPESFDIMKVNPEIQCKYFIDH